MRRREEPLSFDADDVAEMLEHYGCEQMAAFVRRLGRLAQERNQRESLLIARNDELRRRLLKHEPEEKPRDPVWTGD